MDEHHKAQARMLTSQMQPVPLRVAASLVYHQLNRNIAASGRRSTEYEAALNSTCIALSQVADVYHADSRGTLLRIPSEELARGVFEGGGESYRTPSGNVYSPLSMRRFDVMEAIAVLRKALETPQPGGESAENSPEDRPK